MTKPREIKNPINSLTEEQLVRSHTITKYLYRSTCFWSPRSWQLQPWNSV